MKTTENTIQQDQNMVAVRFTPRQLIKHHIENPNERITEQDIENLVLDLSNTNGWLDENRMYKNDNKFSYS